MEWNETEWNTSTIDWLFLLCVGSGRIEPCLVYPPNVYRSSRQSYLVVVVARN